MRHPVAEPGFEGVHGADGGLEHPDEEADVDGAGGQEVPVGPQGELRIDVLPDVGVLPVEGVQEDPRALARRAEVVRHHAGRLDGAPVMGHLVGGDLVGKGGGVPVGAVGRVLERDGPGQPAHVGRLELGPEPQDVPAVGVDVGRPVHEPVGAFEIGVEVGGRVPDARLDEDVELVEQGLAEPVGQPGIGQARLLPGVDGLLPFPGPDEGLGGDAERVRALGAEEGRVFLLVLGPGLELVVGEIPGDGEGRFEALARLEREGHGHGRGGPLPRSRGDGPAGRVERAVGGEAGPDVGPVAPGIEGRLDRDPRLARALERGDGHGPGQGVAGSHALALLAEQHALGPAVLDGLVDVPVAPAVPDERSLRRSPGRGGRRDGLPADHVLPGQEDRDLGRELRRIVGDPFVDGDGIARLPVVAGDRRRELDDGQLDRQVRVLLVRKAGLGIEGEIIALAGGVVPGPGAEPGAGRRRGRSTGSGRPSGRRS